MTFSETLNGLLQRLDVSRTSLADAAGLSVSTVSRYCAGMREPEDDSDQLRRLAAGLAALAREKGQPLTEAEILAALRGSARSDGLQVDYDVYLFNLRTLMKTLDIRSVSLARALSFDPSHISKILSGQRRPGNIAQFTDAVADYAAERILAGQELPAAAKLLGVNTDEIAAPSALRAAVVGWLGSVSPRSADDTVGSFLRKMNDFDLDAFIRSMRFDEIRLPTKPFQLPTTKTYTGLAQMMESELDFMKATVLSRSMEDCILYSDMPMGEMAADPDFPKKWMLGRAMMLKKGLRLHVIHNVNRPFREMMLGLEGYIPMYMTGQIAPYYLPGAQNGVFTHLLNVSGAAALEGAAIAGHQADGKYTLYKSGEDVRHYRLRAQQLLEKALPLMEIYRSDRRAEFAALLQSLSGAGDRRTVCGSLPLYTMDRPLLEQIIERSALPAADAARVLAYWAESRSSARAVLQKNRITLSVPVFSERQLAETPPRLALSEIFVETDVPYTPEEFFAHLAQTEAFAGQQPNLLLEQDAAPAFRDITYSVLGDRIVLVSKNKSPAIHFVIRNKRMVRAFRDFVPPIRED